MKGFTKHTAHAAGIILALLLAACAEPTTQSLAFRPAPTIAPTAPQSGEIPVATAAPAPSAQQPHAYEGDLANSVTIQAGDHFTIHNPDFTQSYSFNVLKVTADDITITCDDPSVKIKNVGFNDGSLLLAFSLDGTFTKPIGWARYTPKEHIPVVQFYSIAAGGFIERSAED